MRQRSFAAAIGLLIPLALASAAGAQEKLAVTATFSILGDIVARVGGDRVAVKALVGPGGDAHVYQPTPADAAHVAKSRIIFENGLKFEGWISKLIKASGFKGTVVTATKGVKALRVAGQSHGHGHSHSHAESDPHAWQDVKNVLIYVRNIKDALCKIDAAGCASYEANATAYTAELNKLDREIKTAVAAVPSERRKVITSHDAFGYFAKAYGIRFLAPRGISTESEASAKDVARLIDQIRKEKVRALFVENISDPRLIEQIGRETGVKPGGTLYSDALSASDGPAATYLDMVRHNMRLITGAMAGT